jgi:hypothetical protein
MAEIFNKLAITQFQLLAIEALKKDKSGIQLPENLADLMYQTMCENVGEPVQQVSVRDILCCEIPLPFLPNLIDYKIGKGCCDEIVKRDGLFVPCSHHCDENKCAKHLKERSGCGDYWDRYGVWQKKELYCVVIGDKEIKEKSYGSYLHSKKLDSTAVSDELKKWGIQLRLDADLFRAPNKPTKKNRGRKAELKVESADTDEESEPESDAEEPKEPEDKEPKEDPADIKEEPKEPKEPKEEPKDEPKEEPKEPKKKAPPKPRSKKALGTPLDGDGELVKEEMEEKAPKKGKFKGKPENLKDIEHDGTDYKTNGGKYYDKDTLELVAWTSKGEFTLL